MTIGYYKSIASSTRLLALWVACALSISAAATIAAVGTSVPISARLATGIAADIFPVSLPLKQGNLFLTQPTVRFLDDGRIAVHVYFQAFDHRPAKGIAISETGQATVSGIPGYDADTRKILLAEPKIDTLEFDNSNEAAQNFRRQIDSAWSTQVTNPLRAEIPPHPYILPFRNNIQGLAYDGKNLILTLGYR